MGVFCLEPLFNAFGPFNPITATNVFDTPFALPFDPVAGPDDF